MQNYNNLKSLGSFIDYNDGSIKSVFKSTNGGVIEMTLINNKSYDVLCVPTHHFCSLGCKMCHLTNNKLNKCMMPIECNEFIEAVLKSVCHINPEKNYDRRTNKKDLLISFMGVGEPLLNQTLIKQVLKMKILLSIYYTIIIFHMRLQQCSQAQNYLLNLQKWLMKITFR